MNEIPLPVFFIYLYGFKVIGGIFFFLLESEGLLLAFLFLLDLVALNP